MFKTNFRLNAMKKLLYLFIISGFLISCNSDDSSDWDPIIGSWKLTSIISDNKEIYIEDECGKKSITSFLKDGSTIDYYFYNDNSGKCINSENTSLWENKGNSIYKIDDFEFNLEFSNNNNTYKFSLDLKNADNKDIIIISTYTKI